MTQKAILLIGPTGSGKTPFGNMLSKTGINGLTFSHFDFGEQLRNIVSGENSCGMSDANVTLISEILTKGALLENETFYLAEEIINYFLKTGDNCSYVVLNGLPRHTGQADNISRFFNIIMVISLDCTPETVMKRIASNSGGDRTERDDDTLLLIQNKLKIFKERTEPLIEYYKNNNCPVINLNVQQNTTPDMLIFELKKNLTFFK